MGPIVIHERTQPQKPLREVRVGCKDEDMSQPEASRRLDEFGEAMPGRLLIATPAISEGVFKRSVILLLEHSNEGSLGVILNRPSDTDVSVVMREAILRRLPELDNDVIALDGGPVSADEVILLSREGDDWVGLDLDGGSPQGPVYAFSGYAGWGAGQLEQELEEGSWWVVEDRSLQLKPPVGRATTDLWRHLLMLQPWDLCLVSTAPEDPDLN